MVRNVRATHNKHLRDSDVAAEYLNEALEDGITGLANRTHLGRESMYKMLSASGNPKLSSFTKLIHGLGLKFKIEANEQNHSRL